MIFSTEVRRQGWFDAVVWPRYGDSSQTALQKYFDVAFEHWYPGPKQDTCGDGVGLAQ